MEEGKINCLDFVLSVNDFAKTRRKTECQKDKEGDQGHVYNKTR